MSECNKQYDDVWRKKIKCHCDGYLKIVIGYMFSGNTTHIIQIV